MEINYFNRIIRVTQITFLFIVSDLSNSDFVFVFIYSYVHFHALNCSLGAIILVDIGSLNLWPVRGGLFAIIKGLQHSCVGTRLRQQKVVLKYSIILVLLLLRELRGPIILKVLHESRWSFIHGVVRSPLLRGVVEPRGRGIGTRAESWVVQVFILVLLSPDGAPTVGELAPRWLVGLVQSIRMAISRGLSSPRDSCMVSAGNLTTELAVVQVWHVA